MVDDSIERLERLFEQTIDVSHAVAVCNGSAALHTALVCSEIGYDDIVIVTPYTFPATVNAIMITGGRPRFVDIDPDTYCLDTDLVQEVLDDEDISAVLTVDLFGNFASDMKALWVMCRQNNIPLIEDASQAFGATHQGRFAGTWGDIGTFSFYASKNLWSFEGGMVVTGSHSIAEKARIFRNHGMKDGEMVMLGTNYKFNRLCALVAETNLRLHLPAIISELGRYGPEDGYYPRVVYEYEYYRKLGITGNCPVAEEMARKVREQ